MRAPAADTSILRRCGSLDPRPAQISHPDFNGLVQYTSRPRPDDDEIATAQTIAEMARLIREDSRAASVRQLALGITAGAGDTSAAIRRIFDWVKAHVRFREDSDTAALGHLPEPDFAEVLIRPVDLLAMTQPTGDCDDFSMITAALCRAIGIKCDLVTIAAAEPDIYSHVYVLATLPKGKQIPLDTSHGPYPGWSAQPVGKYRVWSIDSMSSRLNGLGDTTDLSSNFTDFGFPTDAGGSSYDWSGLADKGVDIFGSIAKAQWGQPNLQPGTYIRSGNNEMFRQQPGSTSLQFPTTALGSGSGGSLILLAVVALVLILALKGRS